MPFLVRPAVPEDWPGLWRILEPVIRAADTYALDADMDEDSARRYWMGMDRSTFVAEEDGRILGTYYLRANQAGGGSHVCNAGYMTHPRARGRGMARRMATHSLELARSAGYRAMQFNFVVSSNEAAVALWQSLGFHIVGRLPAAFHHPLLGEVDALVMHRFL